MNKPSSLPVLAAYGTASRPPLRNQRKGFLLQPNANPHRWRNNQAAELPESTSDLRSLRYLNLRANSLMDLPESLAELLYLEKLDPRWNRIDSLSDLFRELGQRECLVYR